MIQVDNFKFKQLLEQSGLSQAEKYDISNIFSCLSNDRKMEIIDKWPIYLNQILAIREESYEKRRAIIDRALQNINNLVNEAILRQRDDDARKERQRTENNEIMRNAQTYDQLRKNNNLQNLIKEQHDKL
jgi:hypothetical protein